ncbi:MAG: pentapeptide repeat-containing protein, partial [Nanoarchaeota archaeon]|nr:pentapeptide repeat-containing protein [Nanoarchaeota archaeon]
MMMAGINDILDRLRKGDIKGRIEFEIDDKGRVKKIVVAPQNDYKEISESIERIKAEAKDISGADFSKTRLSGDLSGMDLKGSNFSYARIEGANLSGSNLEGASFQKAT